MQPSDFGGPSLLHQAVQACCLGDPGMKIALDDDHGLCNEEKSLGLPRHFWDHKRFPAWWKPTRLHLPLQDPGPPSSFCTPPPRTFVGLVPKTLVEKNLFQPSSHQYFQASPGQVMGREGRSTSWPGPFTPPPPGRELK